LEEYLPTLDFVPSGVDASVFYDFIVFIMKRYCMMRGRFVTESWREVFDLLSFTAERDVLCVNEFLTQLQLMSFPHDRDDVTRLFRDISEDGLITRKRFQSFQEVAHIINDGSRYGIDEAKKNHWTRTTMPGGIMKEPERPKSLAEITEGTMLMSTWHMGRQQIAEQKRLFDDFDPKAAAREAMAGVWETDSDHESKVNEAFFSAAEKANVRKSVAFEM
jgi:hypothetical protein